MLYYERKPYHYTDGSGNAIGLAASPTTEAFAKAGISLKWELTPAARILEQLKRNAESLCTPGWYKTAEREEYARFSVPIYRDKAAAGLVRPGLAVPAGITARELLAHPDIRLLNKQGFVASAYLTELVAKMPASQIVTTSTDIPNMVKMIHLGRADVFIIPQEEVEIYVTQAELRMSDFKVLKFADVPAVEMRYILCSKQVPTSTMDALNAAIARTVHLSK